MIPLRESITAAAFELLQQRLDGVTVERARRAPAELDEMPHVVLFASGMTADEEFAAGECAWTVELVVVGHAKGETDLEAEQALSELHARTVQALQAADLGPGSVQVSSEAAEMSLYAVEDAADPCGRFEQRFSVLAVAPVGSPYAP